MWHTHRLRARDHGLGGGVRGGHAPPVSCCAAGTARTPPSAANASALIAHGARPASRDSRNTGRPVTVCSRVRAVTTLVLCCVVCENHDQDVQCATRGEELTAARPGDEKLCYTDRGDYLDLGSKTIMHAGTVRRALRLLLETFTELYPHEFPMLGKHRRNVFWRLFFRCNNEPSRRTGCSRKSLRFFLSNFDNACRPYAWGTHCIEGAVRNLFLMSTDVVFFSLEY